MSIEVSLRGPIQRKMCPAVDSVLMYRTADIIWALGVVVWKHCCRTWLENAEIAWISKNKRLCGTMTTTGYMKYRSLAITTWKLWYTERQEGLCMVLTSWSRWKMRAWSNASVVGIVVLWNCSPDCTVKYYRQVNSTSLHATESDAYSVVSVRRTGMVYQEDSWV